MSYAELKALGYDGMTERDYRVAANDVEHTPEPGSDDEDAMEGVEGADKGKGVAEPKGKGKETAAAG